MNYSPFLQNIDPLHVHLESISTNRTLFYRRSVVSQGQAPAIYTDTQIFLQIKQPIETASLRPSKKNGDQIPRSLVS